MAPEPPFPVPPIEALLALLGETAAQGAALYAAHSGRPAATAEDVKRALMLDALVYANRPGVLDRVQVIHRDLSPRRRGGGCPLCRWFEEVYEEWTRWEPQTSIEIDLKTRIESL